MPPSSPLLALLGRRPQAVVLSCFFLSGATGLVYEVVWSRRLTLTFGATVLAVSTVLAAFLGGLAVGSVIFGRLADRRPDSLRLYALLEGGVGLVCLLTPWLFVLVERAYVQVHPALAGQVWLLRSARFVLCGAVLLVPTALMGGTLPALSRAVVRSSDQIGAKVAALYGINTLGAVVGAGAAGFVLIPVLGLRGTIDLAAVINLAIALIAYGLHVCQGQAATPEVPAPEEPQPAAPRRGAYYALLLAYGLSGAAALIYEVGWTRILSLAFGTTTYAFSAMLAAFLAGIGLGSLVLAGARWAAVDRLRVPVVWFGVVEVAIGATVTLLTPALDRLPFVFLALFRWLGSRFWALQMAQLAVCFLVMVVPAALMGFAFPLVTRLATQHVAVLGRRLAAVYAANTVGTVIGSFMGGFVLIPVVGVRYALGVGVGLNVLVGLAYLLGAFRLRPRLAGGGAALAALTVLAWVVLPDWNRAVLTSGAYVYPQYYLSGDPRARMAEKELLYYRDGLTATVSVTRVRPPGRGRPLLSLQINGKTDASTGDLSTQLLLAHLPALLHPQPRSALVIGLASGCTLGALALHGELQEIDCVEIEPEMARVADLFTEINRNCLQDRRVHLYLDDARNFVLVTQRKYDLITSEPSNPWIAGVANLFTREHFRLCRERLNPGGVFCQWLPLYNLAPEDLRSIVATFQDVFPHCSFWLFPDLASDAYLIGTLSAQRIGVKQVAARMGRGPIAGDMAMARVPDLWSFLSGYLFGAETMTALGQGARLNTDDSPVLEFTSPMTLHTGVAQLTLGSTIALGKNSSPPLGQCGERVRGRYRSALAGVLLGPLWSSPESETFHVHRTPQAYSRGGTAADISQTVRLSGHLGSGRAELYVRSEAAPPGDEFPLNPSGAANLRLQVSGHVVSVWTSPDRPSGAAWVGVWSCPQRGRAAMVIAFPGADGKTIAPGTALAQVRCDH